MRNRGVRANTILANTAGRAAGWSLLQSFPISAQVRTFVADSCCCRLASAAPLVATSASRLAMRPCAVPRASNAGGSSSPALCTGSSAVRNAGQDKRVGYVTSTWRGERRVERMAPLLP